MGFQKVLSWGRYTQFNNQKTILICVTHFWNASPTLKSLQMKSIIIYMIPFISNNYNSRFFKALHPISAPTIRVRIRRYRIAKCDTISTNCYAFAQNASQKVRRIVFCENEWVIAPLTSVKNSCWSMFSKPKSSNFEAKNLFNLTSIDDCYIKTSPWKTPTI